MKTQEILKNKTKFNWFYLMLAIALFYAGLNISATTRFWQLTNYELNDTKLWLFLAGIFYCFNWLYGKLYFPMKYKKILRDAYVPDHELTDLSYLRGSLAAAITIFAIMKNISDIHSGYQIWVYVLALPWLIVHYFLASYCRTDKLFYSTSIMIDEVILMPWLNRGDNADHRYVDIYYAQPTEEDEDAWTKRVIIAYASHKRHWYMSQTEDQRKAALKHNEDFFQAQRQEEQEATELSANIYSEIK